MIVFTLPPGFLEIGSTRSRCESGEQRNCLFCSDLASILQPLVGDDGTGSSKKVPLLFQEDSVLTLTADVISAMNEKLKQSFYMGNSDG